MKETSLWVFMDDNLPLVLCAEQLLISFKLEGKANVSDFQRSTTDFFI